MALRGHVFDKQLFSSECFALFIDTFLGKQSGIVNGCAVNNTTNSVSIGNGYFCLQGRFLQEEGETTFDLETVEQDTYCKLICEIDLSKENTTSSLNQATYKILTDENDYPILTQGDITQPNTVYQFEFAKFKNTSTGIQDFTDTRSFLDFDSIYSEIRRDMGELLEDEDEAFDTWFESFKEASNEDFDEWIQTLQEVLDENTAGHLLNLINQNTNAITTKSDKKKTYTITLDTTWTGNEAPYTKTVQVEGILATDIVNINPIYSSTLATRLLEKEEYSKISMIESANGSVTLTCDEEVLTMALNVRLEVVY